MVSGAYLLYGGNSVIEFPPPNHVLSIHIQPRLKSVLRPCSYTSAKLEPMSNSQPGLTVFGRLLGISAFAGFFILVIGWPLNTYVAKRSIRIHKGFLTAKDKRMGVISELIGAVRHISAFLRTLAHLSLSIGEVHQILRLGESLDSTKPRCPRSRDEMARPRSGFRIVERFVV